MAHLGRKVSSRLLMVVSLELFWQRDKRSAGTYSPDRCDPACGYGGTCQQGNTTATCQCRPGWGGQTCDQCASGHFGADCQRESLLAFAIERNLTRGSACAGDCTQCDDGLAGTGTCLGTKTDSLKRQSSPVLIRQPADGLECDCLHGTCNSANECTCAAGWITNSSASIKCNTCAPGFFQTKSSDCQGMSRYRYIHERV